MSQQSEIMPSFVTGHSSCDEKRESHSFPLCVALAPRACANAAGFTLVEILIVLFLLAGVSAIVIPRMLVGEDVGSTGRKLISTLRGLQGMAASSQKPVKLYMDIDQGTYWAMVVEGKEEKLPLDAGWATPRSLPDAMRFIDVSVGQTKRVSGKAQLSFYPNGRIDPVILHIADGSNNLLGIAVESFTGAIRTSDERIEPALNQRVPDRVKLLLQATLSDGGASPLGVKFQ